VGSPVTENKSTDTPLKHTWRFLFTGQIVLMQYFLWININWPFH